MKNYVGIDLGTTNSAICSYDGEQTRIWKSPEQNDVTPSAIYIGRRGNKYVGKRAYDSAARSPDNAATLFKRLMGTSTPIRLPAVEITMTPEECSGEMLRALFGYLPEEVRNNPDTGTVITVPAAFNQMQKNATMEAAEMAGIGRVALMQEPVAAVMSVMRARSADAIFVIYDLGGGTLDVAIAESLAGRINLLAHGGIAMCGGRDFDRLVVDNVIKPWLLDEFDLPENLSANPSYKRLMRVAAWAAERAKVELSAREETAIRMEEVDVGVRDESGEEIYLDIPVNRSTLDGLMTEKVDESIEATRETLDKAGLTPHDVERVVFIGGPTVYKPLRDRVAFELGLPASTEVNPMTAVAEGAAIFAESIDWTSQSRNRKTSRGSLTASGPLKVTFNYNARTPSDRAKIIAQVDGEVAPGTEFQVDNLDTGWNSGRIVLAHGATVGRRALEGWREHVQGIRVRHERRSIDARGRHHCHHKDSGDRGGDPGVAFHRDRSSGDSRRKSDRRVARTHWRRAAEEGGHDLQGGGIVEGGQQRIAQFQVARRRERRPRVQPAHRNAED